MTMPSFRSRAGFTIAELSISATIMVIAVTLAIGAFVYLLKGVYEKGIQDELDVDVQKSMERVKRDVRLSALDQMLFYPTGSNAYTAMSFPMAEDTNGDKAIDLDANGKIIWTKQVIYHVWNSRPQELRVTTFKPRDNTLSDAQRIEQLQRVVAEGHGSNTYNSAHARTEIIFRNLFKWSISPQGGKFDGYLAYTNREEGISLGSVLLTPGNHVFTFTAIDKAASATNYYIGIDKLVVSASGSDREAEALPSTVVQVTDAGTQIGPYSPYKYSAMTMQPIGTWSGNRQLLFPANSKGDSIALTLYNDRWEETTFRQTGATFNNTTVQWSPSGNADDYVLMLDGNTTSWDASRQTGNADGYSTTNDPVRACAVRVQIRGKDMPTGKGGWIDYDGGNCAVLFRATANTNWVGTDKRKLRILAAYIAESASSTTPGSAIKSGTSAQLGFPMTYWSASITIDPGSSAYAYVPYTRYPIDKRKSYTISYLVEDNERRGCPYAWSDLRVPGTACCWIKASSSASDLTLLDWSGATPRDVIYGVASMHTYYPTNGVYESKVFDTQCTAPQYSTMTWNADLGINSGASLSMKARTGDNPTNLTTAGGWSSWTPVSGSSVSLNSKRYVQFSAVMTPDSGIRPSFSPRLRDVTITWPGATRLVDVGGSFTKGPAYGTFEMKVDGITPRRGLSIYLEIFEDMLGIKGNKRVTSALSSEVEPRNTNR